MMQSTELDLGPLTWVKGEIDQALAKALACIGEARTSGEPSTQLQFAQTHVHQVCGALAIVGLDAVARFATALERLLGAMSRNEQTIEDTEAFALATRAIAAIGNYLEDLARNEIDQPLRLARLFCEIENARGVELASPAELFNAEIIHRPNLPVSDITDDKRRWNAARRARVQFESGLLQWLKNPADPSGADKMAKASALACALQGNQGGATFWWASQAFLQALADQSLPANALVRRVCTQLGRELRRFANDHHESVPEHLLRDVLFWVSQAPATTPQQQQVHNAWQLDTLIAATGSQVRESPLAPLVKELLQDIGAAKEEWDHFSEGQAVALPAFQQKLESAIEHCSELGRPTLNTLFAAIAEAARTLRLDPIKFEKSIGIEVASALLLSEMWLDKSMSEKEFQAQANNTVARLQAIARGESPSLSGELPASNVVRKLGERQARVQVAREILSSLAHIEQTLDDFFRDQGKRAPLLDLDGPLRQIRGALSLLDDARATDLVEQAAETIAILARTEAPDPTLFEPLAHQLSALGMYVDALQHGATNIQRFLGGIDSVEPEAVEIQAPAQLETELPSATSLQPLAVKDPEPAIDAVAEADDDLDAELLDIFIEEAAEVVATINGELPKLRTDHDSFETLTTIRRGFHTLKGSGRMVGLIELSDAAKEVEQTLNLWLQLERKADSELTWMVSDAANLFDAWVQQISSGGAHGYDAMTVVKTAERLRHVESDTLTDAKASPVAPSFTLGEVVTPTLQDQPADIQSTLETPEASPEALIEEEVETLDYADFELYDFDPASLNEADLKPAASTADADSVKIEESFLSTVIQLDNQIFTDGEDPTLRITALDTQAFDFEEYDYTPLPLETPEKAPDIELPTETDISDLDLQDDDSSDDQALEIDLDIDLETLGHGEPSQTWERDADSLDGPEAQPFDFGELSLDLDLSDEAGELDERAIRTEHEALDDLVLEPTQTHADFTLDDANNIVTTEETASESAAEPTDTADVSGATAEPNTGMTFTPSAPAPAQLGYEPDVMTIGDVEVSAGLFGLFTVEAGQHLGLLDTECAAFRNNPNRIPSDQAHRAAHTLAGISATTRIEAMHTLARALEHALQRLRDHDTPPTDSELSVLSQSVETLSAMLGLAKTFTMPSSARLLETQLESIGNTSNWLETSDEITPFEPLLDSIDLELDEYPSTADITLDDLDDSVMTESLPDEPVDTTHHESADTVMRTAIEDDTPFEPSEPSELTTFASAATTQAAPAPAPKADAATALKDDLDPQLLSIFLEEGEDLLGQLNTRLRQWRTEPQSTELGVACARLLHTLKGSARMAGAMRLGEHIHQIESWLESSRQGNADTAVLCDELEASLDIAAQQIAGLSSPTPPETESGQTSEPGTASAPQDTAAETQDAMTAGLAVLRIRADKVDNFVNQAGEIGIARTRIEGEMRTIRSSLLDLTENVIRLRNQLREVELQAETQMQSRIAQAESAHSEFDPLEMDRYTRLQELTRMMAESVGDVTTVQHTLLRNLDGAEIALHSQARMARELQQSLMQVRMVPFDSIADRLHRIVRQSAKDLGKRANLDLRGGRIEIDRGVLETMVAPLEHLLRNAVAHGIESPDQRQVMGKSPIGQITLAMRQEGNEVGITLSDDGAGLNLDRIAERALAQGLLSSDEAKDPSKLANMIFVPGFTTAGALSAVSGRGIGMDVVKADTASVGGRVDVSSQPGSGTEFRINLPLTLAATQALLVRAAGTRHAIPSNLIAQVMEIKADVLERVIRDGGVMWQDTFYPYTYLPWLIDETDARPEATRLVWLLLLRSGDRTIALHVDSLHGNQEVVVKNAGPQLMRIVGVSGVTLLADGEIVLILNPIALSRRPQVNLTGTPRAVSADTPSVPTPAVKAVPTVLVVDDSLTVRKIAGRLLEREGYRVISAKDGVDALEHLLEEVPDVILSDIEMPRMDGFELLRNIRADERTASTPVIMITSRLADKHREYAMSLGASHYLGKPYDEDELLGLLAGMTGRAH